VYSDRDNIPMYMHNDVYVCLWPGFIIQLWHEYNKGVESLHVSVLDNNVAERTVSTLLYSLCLTLYIYMFSGLVYIHVLPVLTVVCMWGV